MQQSKTSILEAGAKFLASEKVISLFPSDIQAAIKNGEKEYIVAEYYIRKKFASLGGVQKMIKETDDRVAGVTNLDKGKFPTDTYMAIVAVGLGYGYHASSVEVTAPRYSNSEYLNTIPTKIVNSEFTLKNGDRTIISARAKKFFANAYSEFGVEANEENYVLLPQPKLADPKKMNTADFEFAADAVATPANNHFIEIVMYGVQIVDRVKG
jgi:hypothetical protein